jgi:Fe-S cluster assembly protein SufD
LAQDAPVSAAIPADEALVALNSAFALASASLVIAPGTHAGAIHIAFRDAHEAAANLARRVRIEVQAGASVTIIESHESRNGLGHLTNTLIEFELGDGAKVHHVRVNSCGDEANSLSTLAARVGDNANFATLSMTTGARVSRHQIFVRFAGEHAHVALRGVSLLRGKQHADTTLVIDHATPNCESREAFKTIVDGDATGVFQGRIVVAPHAQKTDARMSSKALLLSEGATMNNKPELEIFADDVQCAHGATCGELDDNLLFYIMARGLPKREAEALLLEAFVGDVIDEVEDEALREALMVRARNWLAERT